METSLAKVRAILGLFLLLPVIAAPQNASAVDLSRAAEAEKEVVAIIQPGAPPDPHRLTLARCLELALVHNFDIKEAEKLIARQKGVVLEARSLLLPTISANAGFKQVDPTMLDSFQGTTLGSEQQFNALGQIVQPLYTGGEGTALSKQQDLNKLALESDLRAVVNNVIFKVQSAFYDVLLARARIDVQEGAVLLLEEQLELQKKQLASGRVSDFNVLRAEVELANARTPLIRARNELRTAMQELARLLGIREGEDTPFKLAGSLEYEETQWNLPELLKTAEQNRPELNSLRIRVQAQEAGIRVAQSGYLPRIEIFGGYGAQTSAYQEHIDDTTQGWMVGLQGRWNFFDGLRTQGRVQQAQADAAISRVNVERELQGIQVEVQRAVSRLLEARELVQASQKVVTQAEESRRLANARLQAGAAQQIDLLDAQVALTEARTNAIEALHAFNLARAETQRAVGAAIKTE